MSTEFTLRVEADMFPALDAVVQSSGLPSRKEAIEEILKRWHQAWLQQKIDREIVAYYTSRTPEEIEEDRIWARFSSEQALARWED